MFNKPYIHAGSTDWILRDYLAAARTVLANERTLLAYIRTALAILLSGAVLIRFAEESIWTVVFGWALMPFGAFTFIWGIHRFRQTAKDMEHMAVATSKAKPSNNSGAED